MIFDFVRCARASVALVASLSAAEAVAETPEPSTAQERTAREPRCAKPWCQRARSFDRVSEAQSRSTANDPRSFSLSLGFGAAWIGAPTSEGVYRIVSVENSGEAGAKARSLGSELDMFALPTVSPGVVLQQPFFSIGTLPLHLEEHFGVTLAEDWFTRQGSAVTGFADFLVGVRALGPLPMSASFGVALGVSHVDFGEDAELLQINPYHFVLATIGLVRFELGEPLPGGIRIITRQGKLYDAGTYRDLQVAFELAL